MMRKLWKSLEKTMNDRAKDETCRRTALFGSSASRDRVPAAMATNGTSTPPGLEVPSQEEVRDAVLRDIEAKVAEKMEEVWQKGRQMLAQARE